MSNKSNNQYKIFQQTQDSLNAQSIEELQQETDKGNLDAQAELGFRLCNSQNTPQDIERGLNLLKQCVEHENLVGMFHYSKLLIEGKIVNQDYTVAMDLLKNLHDQHIKQASGILGMLYYDQLIRPSKSKSCFKGARECFEAAQDLNVPEWNFRLANLYVTGEGGKISFYDGCSLLDDLAKQEYEPAIHYLAHIMYENNMRFCHGSLTPFTLKWLNVSKDLGDAKSAFYLGCFLKRFHQKGDCLPSFLLATNLGSIEAKLSLFHIYRRGSTYHEQDQQKAQQLADEIFKECQEKAQNSDAEALMILGRLHKDGIGCEKNINLAESFYKKAGKAGNAQAYLELGDYFNQRHQTETAIKYYLKAAGCSSNKIGWYYAAHLFAKLGDNHKYHHYLDLAASGHVAEALTEIGDKVVSERKAYWFFAKAFNAGDLSKGRMLASYCPMFDEGDDDYDDEQYSKYISASYFL